MSAVAPWTLFCSACTYEQPGERAAGVCPECAQPLLVRHLHVEPGTIDSARWDLWRYRAALPLMPAELPVSLGEGMTPLLESRSLAADLGVGTLRIKDEALNPTGSFKARGMSVAVTRARALGAKGFVVPTAGNAGAALAAYAAAAGLPARVFAPDTTPAPLLAMTRSLGATVVLVAGHIGDAGRAARAFAAESGYLDVSTLREPYRIEGKKTMGMEIAEQLGWRLPTVIVYPTGGGTGLIGMWKVFAEMREWGWIASDVAMPRMIVAQSAGCAPIVRALQEGATSATPWENPTTHASGLRVPGPLGDRLILRAVRESGGTAIAVSEEQIRSGRDLLAESTGIDAAPEGGCALEALRELVKSGLAGPDDDVVVFNTGSGASYRF